MNNSKPTDNKISSNILGAAGEYFVAAELSRRGVIATITLKNTPLIDVIASKLDGTKTVNIQVKTKQNTQGWLFSNKMEETVRAKNFFVVFADLAVKEKVDYYIIPRNELSRAVAKQHKIWKATLGRGGRPHVDNPIRFFDPDCRSFKFPQFLKYKNNWDVLGIF